jgi:hypothetical protein
MGAKPPFSLGVSIVLYKTPMSAIAPLLAALQSAGAAKIFVIDNSPRGFDPSGEEYQSAVVERYCTGRNLGYGRAHNIAIRRSVGIHEYHLICNPDIAISGGAISLLAGFMEANPNVGLCMPKLVGTDGEIQYCCRRSPLVLDYVSQLLFPPWGRRRRNSLEMRSCDYHGPMEVQCLSGCFMFFRSEILQRLGGFDERFFMYFEDFDLSLRSREIAKNVYRPEACVVHERQSAHKRSWRLKLIFAQSAMRYFSKWGWLSTRVPESSG